MPKICTIDKGVLYGSLNEPLCFSPRCLSGESYEMEFPQDAHTKPPKELVAPRRHLISSDNN